MKVNKFNTRKAASTPRKLSLRDPYTKETLIDEDGKTVDFFVYGMQSDKARNALKNRDRKYGKGRELSDEEAARSGAEFLAAITQGWSPNVEGEDGPIPFSFEAAVDLYMEEDWIARQVQEFAMEIRNFDPLRSAGSSYGSGSSHGSTQSQKKKAATSKDETPEAGAKG